MMRPFALRAALVFALLLGTAEAGKRRGNPDVIDDALAYALTDRAKAVALLESALAEDPDGKSAAWIAAHAGEHKRLQGDLTGALQLFEQAAAQGGNSTAGHAGRLGAALVRAASSAQPQDLDVLGQVAEKGMIDTLNADRFLVLAVDAAGRDESSRVNQHSKRALSWAKADPAVYARVAGALDALARGEAPPLADSSRMERAREALRKGDGPRAAHLAREAEAEAEAGSLEQLAAHYLAKRAEANRPVDPNTVAVLLPLSGRYQAVGRQVREALEYGYKAGGGTRKLVFHDTLATPEGAVKALEKAVLEEGAVAVVGPLLSDDTEAVVRAAAAIEVPLISLSQSNEATLPWVFQGVPSVGDQARALVDHVMQADGMKNFATFAPDTPYGRRAAEAFRGSVEARGGEIRSEVFYDPEATALMPFAKQLGRKDPEARKAELWKLRREAEAAGGNPASVVLPPTIDYDAIFLPDNARKIPIACAALAYEEFPIGDFKPRRTDKGLPLLGLSGWNAPELVAAGGEYTRSSRFIDGFAVETAPEFVAAYKGALGRTPTSLEAMTVDAGRLLGVAARNQAQDREGFLAALGEASTSGTPTGATGFAEANRRVQSTLSVFTIDREGIKPVAPAAP